MANAAAAAAIAAVSNGKKRRIMIITADESIIEQIQNNNHPSSFQSIYIESQNDNFELSLATDGSDPRPSTSNRSKNNSLICVVCGSKALGYNFDAITCESCKAFFRRNALKKLETFQCRRKNDCEINIETRRRCSACRLSKCLHQGMKADRLLTVSRFKKRYSQSKEFLSHHSQKKRPPKGEKLKKIEVQLVQFYRTHRQRTTTKAAISIFLQKSIRNAFDYRKIEMWI